MSRGCRRGGGCCWTTWTSWCTSFIPNCANSTSWSASGATRRCWRPSPGEARAGRKDDFHAPYAMDRRYRRSARAVRRGAARGTVFRPEQGAVPDLRLPHHSDGTLRDLLLSRRTRGRARRGADGGAVVRPAVAHPAPPVPGSEADHPVRVAVRLPADEHHRRHGRGAGRGDRVL